MANGRKKRDLQLRVFGKRLMQSALAFAVAGFMTVLPATPAKADVVYSMQPMLEVLDFPIARSAGPQAIRNTAITYLVQNTAHDVRHYQGQTNAQLYDALMYAFHLQMRGVRAHYMRTLSVDALRNTSIVIVNQRTGRSVPQLQGMSAFNLLVADNMNPGVINGIYFNENQWRTSPAFDDFRLDATSGECGQYDNAIRQLQIIPAQLSRARSEYNQIQGKLDQAINAVRSVPLLGSIAASAINRHPVVMLLTRDRDSKRREIERLEAAELASKNIVNNQALVSACLTCREQQPRYQAYRDAAKPFQRYTDYLQALRRQTMTAQGQNQNVPPQTGATPFQTAVLADLDNPSSRNWQFMRFSWITRNDPPLQCT